MAATAHAARANNASAAGDSQQNMSTDDAESLVCFFVHLINDAMVLALIDY